MDCLGHSLVYTFTCIAQVEKLRSEAGHHSAQQRTRLKNRAADAKRIQDLERQVCNTVLFPVLS